VKRTIEEWIFLGGLALASLGIGLGTFGCGLAVLLWAIK
jgi:hypothetical protein